MPGRALLPAHVRLIHPFPVSAVMAVSAVLLVLAFGHFPGWSIFTRALSVVLLSQVSVGALNDFRDRKADARWQPRKPIPAGEVSPASALLMSVTAGALVVPLAATFGPASAVVAGLGLTAGLGYDLGLKGLPISFLAYQAGFLSLVTWIWLLAGGVPPGLAALYPGAALLVFAAHVAQSLPDIATDRAQGSRGTAVAMGEERSIRAVVLACSVTAIGALGLALASQATLSVALASAGLALLACAGGLARSRRTRAALVLFFRLVIPAIGLIAVSAVLAARSAGWV